MANLLITKKSQKIVQKIIDEMEGQTFHHHFHILYDIISSIDKDSINYFEIGLYCGSSGSLVMSHPKRVNGYFMDTFSEAPVELVERNFNKFKNPESKYDFIIGDSQQSQNIDVIKKRITEIDLFYIDGDHSYWACINDFLNYRDLIASGGYIVFDDYRDFNYSPQVKHTVDYIVSELLFDC